MAARALKRYAEYRRRNDRLGIVEHSILIFLKLVWVEIIACCVHSRAQKAGCGDLFFYFRRPLLGVAIIRDFISCDLFSNKLIVRLIANEAANHIVSITPSIRADQILLEDAFAVRITCSIQPVPRPTLAVSGIR